MSKMSNLCILFFLYQKLKLKYLSRGPTPLSTKNNNNNSIVKDDPSKRLATVLLNENKINSSIIYFIRVTK